MSILVNNTTSSLMLHKDKALSLASKSIRKSYHKHHSYDIVAKNAAYLLKKEFKNIKSSIDLQSDSESLSMYNENGKLIQCSIIKLCEYPTERMFKMIRGAFIETNRCHGEFRIELLGSVSKRFIPNLFADVARLYT